MSSTEMIVTLRILTYEVSYSKNIKFFRNAKFILVIGFQNVFWELIFAIDILYLQDQKFLRFRTKITKISSAIIYSATKFALKVSEQAIWKFC